MASSSSGSNATTSLMTGEFLTESEPSVVAVFRPGDNNAPGGAAEYTLAAGEDRRAEGRLIWDVTHGVQRSKPFRSVAMVHFEMRPACCRWSVGTAGFIECDPGPYGAVQRVLLVAAVKQSPAPRVLQWDWADFTLEYGDGRREQFSLAALPRASSGQTTRRSVFGAPAQHDGGAAAPSRRVVQQYASISTSASNVVGVSVTGQVLLRANDSTCCDALSADDLQGKVLVFTGTPPASGHAPA